MKKNLFVYGSLILEKSPIKLVPVESVFVLEYKLTLKQKENSNYFFIQLTPTGKVSDIVSGYLTEVEPELFEKLDKYEGSAYKRKEIVVFKRDNTPIKAFAYVAKK